ncbi:MAG: hypothetical protein ABEI99_10985 [Halobaculum sp.]
MTTTRRVVLCTILVVLAGCSAVPAMPWSESGGDAPAAGAADDAASTPTATPEPARKGLVGTGANATFTGGNFSAERLRAAHRAYFERAASVTVVEWGTFTLRTNVDSAFVNVSGAGTSAGLTVVRVNDSTDTLLSQSFLGNETARRLANQSVFVGNASRIAVRGENSGTAAAIRQFVADGDPSAPGTYVNETGAVFHKSIADDAAAGYEYEYNPAGSPLANSTTRGNVTGMYFPTLTNTNLTYRGNGSVAGFSGHVYTARNASALQPDALEFVNRSNVTAFALTVVVAPDGYVRYLNLTYAVDVGGSPVRLDVKRAIVAVNETTVPKPDWLDRARKNPKRELFNISMGDGDGVSFGKRAANDTATLGGGQVTLNVTMSEPVLDPRAEIRPTERFHNPNLDRWRVGSVARYSYSTRNVEEVRITIHYDDSQVPGPESNVTTAVWDREEQFFVPLEATVDTEANTVTIRLTGEEIERWEGHAILAMDYERYLAFFEDDG